ncbi:hypothetical protein [Silvimonas amylolytica]|uniref:Uncharacterized protein n=1 Tax=Silvimonas amylolytica TaxID=449663 RepID=A0ABQ2PJT9_9NEIS|nr:hypothetical protein [Silvimonas amylolytica]GGP25864.1 hypothetical protein GCM10010971_16830 [Silvimonas amylolytica]
MKSTRPQTTKTSADTHTGIVSQAATLLADLPSAHMCVAPTPRMKRLLATLVAHSSLMREQIDALVGCSNAPGLVFTLRNAGLELPCTPKCHHDRDGLLCRPGRYCLTEGDRFLAQQWLAEHTDAPDVS